MNRVLLIMLFALTASGCTVFQVMALKSDVDNCRQRLTNLDEYKSLNARHYMPWMDDYIDTHPSAVDLMDKSTATNDEVTKFIKVHNALQECRKITVERVADIMPQAVPKSVNGFMSADRVLAELFEQKITWGEFAYQFKTVLANTANDVKQEVLQAEMEQQGKLREFSANLNNASLSLISTIFEVWAASQSRMYSAPIYATYPIQPIITDCTVNRVGSSSASVFCSSF